MLKKIKIDLSLSWFYCSIVDKGNTETKCDVLEESNSVRKYFSPEKGFDL